MPSPHAKRASNVTSLQVDTGLAGEGELSYSYALNGSSENAPTLTGLASTQGGSPLWSASVTSDDVGNVTADGASLYAYDLRNHLGSRQVGATTSQHAFTADGRLARLDTGAPADVILDPAGRRMAKRENGLWRDYVYLGDRLVAYFDEGATEAVLVISDHIGMPMMAIDGTGSVVWQAKAEPYGQLRGTVNRPFDPGLRYPGQWQDELEVDASCVGGDCTMPGPLERSFSLFENGYRWYRPDWGRYSQSDPIGLKGGANLYLYGLANPLIYADSQGTNVYIRSGNNTWNPVNNALHQKICVDHWSCCDPSRPVKNVKDGERCFSFGLSGLGYNLDSEWFGRTSRFGLNCGSVQGTVYEDPSVGGKDLKTLETSCREDSEFLVKLYGLLGTKIRTI